MEGAWRKCSVKGALLARFPLYIRLICRKPLQRRNPLSRPMTHACSQPRHSLHDGDTVASLRDMLPRAEATTLPAESKRKFPLRIPGHTPMRPQPRSAVDWELSMCVICTVVGTGLSGFKDQLVPHAVIGSFQMLYPFSCRGIASSPNTGRKGYFWRPAFGARASITRWPPGLLRWEEPSEMPDFWFCLCWQLGVGTRLPGPCSQQRRLLGSL